MMKINKYFFEPKIINFILFVHLLIFSSLLTSTSFGAPPVLRPAPAENASSSSNIAILNNDSDSNISQTSVLPSSNAVLNNKEETDLKPKIDNIDSDPNQLVKPQKAVDEIAPAKLPELVKRPDHLKGVPIERDGHLNKNFRREVLLAAEKEKMQEKKKDRLEAKRQIENNFNKEEIFKMKKQGDKKIMGRNNVNLDDLNDLEENQLLSELFKKTDKNNDGKISSEELENYMIENIVRHLDWGKNETNAVFRIVDLNKNGFATWEEYHYHFLVDKKLMPPEQAKNHDEKSHDNLKPEDQEKIDLEMQQWQSADMNPQDGQLSPEEFLAFRHPEHNKITLDRMVREIFSQLDKNEDLKLSIEEFAESPPANDVDDDEWEESEKQVIEERRKEFKESIDLDHDGFVSIEELTAYSNPSNSQHAKQEVNELMLAADENRDHFLTMDEILKHKDIFMGSSMVNPERNMHDEF